MNPTASDRGLDSYASLQQQLSAHVDTTEAYTARELTNSSLIALAVCVLTVLLLAWLVHLLHVRDFHDVAELIAILAPLAISLLLVTRWRVPAGARIILMVAAVVLNPASDWLIVLPMLAIETTIVPSVDHYASAAFIGNSLLLAAVQGWLIDGGCTRGARGSTRFRWWAIYLTTFSLVQGAFFWVVVKDIDEQTLGLALRMTLIVAWCWVLHPYFANPKRYNDTDTGLVFMMGMLRWNRRLLGRSLAVCSLVVISVATLNGFALPNAFQLDGSDEAVLAPLAVKSGAQPEPYAFLLPKLGRLLRASDFDNDRRRFYMTEALTKELKEELNGLKLQSDYEGYRELTQPSWKDLSAKLEPWRLVGKAEFSEYLARRAGTSDKSLQVWILEKSHTSKSNLAAPAASNSTKYFVANLDSASRLISVGNLPLLLSGLQLKMLAAAIFSSLAFVCLWRRGGDSKAAQWIGIWLAGAAMAFAKPLIQIVYESTFVRVAGLAEFGSFQTKLQGVFYLLYGFEILLYLLTGLAVTYWLVYWHIRSPVVSKSQRHSRALTILDSRLTLFAGIILTLVLSSFLADIVGGEWAAICTTAIALVAIAGLSSLRHQFGKEVEAVDPRLTFGRPVYPISAASIGLFLVAFLSRDNPLASSVPLETKWFWFAVLALITFGIAVLLFLLRSDWLRLSAGRNLSWLLTAFALPLIFEFANNSLPDAFNSIGIFLPEASSIVSILVVVALMQPLQNVLEVVFEAISSPLSRRLRRQLDAILENSMAENDDLKFHDEVEQLLRSHGIEHYTLWTRQGRCEFMPTVDRLNVANSVTLSKQLCSQLAKEKSGVDLEAVHSEWRHFFYQFEFHRLASKINGRYIYPVIFCRSLWGLLVLDDSVAAGGIARNTFAETASELGVALSVKRK